MKSVRVRQRWHVVFAAIVAALTAAVMTSAGASAVSTSQGPDLSTTPRLLGPNKILPAPGSPLATSYTAHSSTPAAAQLHYNGGPVGVQPDPHVYLIFWGSQWRNDSAGVIPYLQAFFRGLGDTQDGWSRVTSQYCQGVPSGTVTCGSAGTHPAFHGPVLAGTWVDTSVAAPNQASDGQIAQEAVNGAAHFGNTTSASNRNAQYVVVSPQGTHPGGFPNAGFCAWHNGTSSPYGDLAFTNDPYMPDGNCGTNWVNGYLDGFSIVGGHEYSETVTDPFPNSGWIDSGGEENADKCIWIRSGPARIQNYPLSTGNFAVQSTWSNQDQGCKIAVPVQPGGCQGQNLLDNPGFESGDTAWNDTSNVIVQPSQFGDSAHSGTWAAWLDGTGQSHVDTLAQQISIASGCTVKLSFWLHVTTAETGTVAYDKLTVQVLDSAGNVAGTLAGYSNTDAAAGYQQHSFDLSAYAGKTITIRFTGTEDTNLQTSFVIDDTALTVS
ncbi:MAG: hypothetical protein HOV83_34085 [Catenulispora sp.]|nr:hypothetical protein [Catenulispora sp.]